METVSVIYAIDLDVYGSDDYDYAIYLYESGPLLYRYEPWEEVEDAELSGLRYLAADSVEVRIPVAALEGANKQTFGARLRFGSTVSGAETEWDESDRFNVVL